MTGEMDSVKKMYQDIVAEFKAEIETLKKEKADLERTFDLCWKADQRAIKMWQEAHPGNDCVWPDRANMVVWLLEKWDALRKTRFVTESGKTHWEGCWRDHYRCAMTRIEEFERK